MTVVDVSGWSKRNCWRTAAGELCVRPGLRRIFTVGAGRSIAGGFSVRDELNGEVWHYVVDFSSVVASYLDPKLTIFDENFEAFLVFPLTSNRVPRGVTAAVVQDQIMICSPDFPPMWALVGGGVVLATKVASVDTTLSNVEVPQSICSAWVGSRVVYARGRTVFVSDPVTAVGGSPRTVTVRNQMNLPGIVYGLHEAAGGMLVAVTDEGVYGLDSSAAAVGVVGQAGGDWRLLNHHAVDAFDSSCVVRGRVYALSRRGYKLVDVENDDETIVSEPTISIAFDGRGRFASDDFRVGRLVGGDEGPILALDAAAAAFVQDVGSPFPIGSWWSSPDFAAFSLTAPIVGVLHDVDGTQILLGASSAYSVQGDFDGGSALSSVGAAHLGSLRGRVPTPPAMNGNARHAAFAAALGGGAPLVRCALRGAAETKVPDADGSGLTIGTSLWGDSRRYTATPLSSVTFDFDDGPTNDVSLEVGADGGLVRLDARLDVDFAESARDRPQNKPST